ncbi:hypothetical protein H2200_010275 [Cladophialophora chaetospira]|uniref:Uncharacterized protein n=1 Tax=Cladophialophora chaetospira TaxID=386627 RepID=A0AA39CER9_9EURO|nr:hypothetical protein H2200_010275 [Cladophialophora chaetospira]
MSLRTDILETSLPSLGYRAIRKGQLDDERDSSADFEQVALVKTDRGEGTNDSRPAQSSCEKTGFYIGVLVLLVCTAVIFASVVPFNGINRSTKWQFPPPEVHVITKSKSNDRPHLCGNSSSEARALGCTFNQLTWVWLPPNCPMYANDQFLEAEDWVYWEDLEQTKAVGDDVWAEVLDGERMIFSEMREHATHCVYYFLSLSQVIRDGTPYYDKMVNYEHYEHCANMLLGLLRQLPKWHELNTLAGTVSFDQYCP